jgi:large subunit ribosomal protein L29
MRTHELREMTRDELIQKKMEIEEELFNLRMQKAFKDPENPLRLRVLRKDRARIETILREDELKIRPLFTEEKKGKNSESDRLKEKDDAEKKAKSEDR